MSRLRLDRDLAIFDLETTGTDIATDRIVQAAVLRVSPDGTEISQDWLVNPGIPIPPEATAVHGITDEAVKNCGTFRELAPAVLRWLGLADLCGFNLIRFDLPLLRAECVRAGYGLQFETNFLDVRIIDAQTIYHQREGRRLVDAVRFYCGREHVGAHDAMADVRATFDVLCGQVRRYEDLPDDPAGLHEFCTRLDPRFVDTDRRFYWRHREATFAFGKHQGVSLREAPLDYLSWMLRQDFSPEVKGIIANALKGAFPVAPPLEQPEASR